MKESDSKEILVTDYSSSTFTEVMRCIYTGGCSDLPLEGALELLSAAEYYSYA